MIHKIQDIKPTSGVLSINAKYRIIMIAAAAAAERHRRPRASCLGEVRDRFGPFLWGNSPPLLDAE
jgi:hypothetical protein